MSGFQQKNCKKCQKQAKIQPGEKKQSSEIDTDNDTDVEIIRQLK